MEEDCVGSQVLYNWGIHIAVSFLSQLEAFGHFQGSSWFSKNYLFWLYFSWRDGRIIVLFNASKENCINIVFYCYLVKRIQAILILANENLVWYRICSSFMESFFIIVDYCTMHVFDYSLELHSALEYHLFLYCKMLHIKYTVSSEELSKCSCNYAPLRITEICHHVAVTMRLHLSSSTFS